MKDLKRAQLRVYRGGKKPYYPDVALAARLRIVAIVFGVIGTLLQLVYIPTFTHFCLFSCAVCFGIAMLIEP